MLGARFTDMHSGLRAYTRKTLLSLPFLLYSNDFLFDTEFLVDAVTTGQRVVEVPIPTRYTKESSSISIMRSLRYVGGSLAYTAGQSVRRGRRGRRSPVTLPPARRGRRIGEGPRVERECVLCGGHDQTLAYPSNADGEVPIDEFTCTTQALARHDDILQCSRCGMISSRPTLAAGEIVDSYAQVVDEAYLNEEEGRRELFSWVADAMGAYASRGRRLLEVGANVGLFLAVARDRGWDVRGIEPSKWAVEQGVERFGVPLRRSTVEELNEPAGSADVLVMLDVLEHLVDPLDALRRLRSVLDDEGLLVLSTVNVSGLHGRLRGERWPWFIRSHLHYFTPETLCAMLARAGYRTVGWETVPRSFHASYVARRMGETLGPFRSAAERLTQAFDPKIPLGWLGDICLVTARPANT
jgi:2-polyprenyl-3-methyl-5-hydroxy-6-metoxy-1,4-benzoquinol methylase